MGVFAPLLTWLVLLSARLSCSHVCLFRRIWVFHVQPSESSSSWRLSAPVKPPQQTDPEDLWPLWSRKLLGGTRERPSNIAACWTWSPSRGRGRRPRDEREREAEPKSSRPPIKAGPPSQEVVKTQKMTKPQPPLLNPTRRPSLQGPRYPGNVSSHRPSTPPPLPRPVSHRWPSPPRASMGCFQEPLILWLMSVLSSSRRLQASGFRSFLSLCLSWASLVPQVRRAR